MKIFESLDKVSNEEMESKILKKWKSEDILNKTIVRTLYSMMGQYMRMLNLVFTMYLLKL